MKPLAQGFRTGLILTALKNAREYCIAQGIHSFIIDKWEDALDMYLEEFSYVDDIIRHTFVEATEKTKFETAKKALSKGISFELVSEIYDLSIDRVREIART